MSSIISFTADTNKINISGTRVVYLPVGDTSGICYNKKIKLVFYLTINEIQTIRIINLSLTTLIDKTESLNQ